MITTNWESFDFISMTEILWFAFKNYNVRRAIETFSVLPKRCDIYVAVKSSEYSPALAPCRASEKLPQLSKRHFTSNAASNTRRILRPFVSHRVGALCLFFLSSSATLGEIYGKDGFTSLIFNPRENWRVVARSISPPATSPVALELDEKFKFKGGERSPETSSVAETWRKPDAPPATETANLQRWLTNLTTVDTDENKSLRLKLRRRQRKGADGEINSHLCPFDCHFSI